MKTAILIFSIGIILIIFGFILLNKHINNNKDKIIITGMPKIITQKKFDNFYIYIYSDDKKIDSISSIIVYDKSIREIILKLNR